MRIEAGKYYRTRDGRKAGPMVGPDWSGMFRDDSIKQRTDTPDAPQWWERDGSVADEREGEDGDTLIAEWSEPNTMTAWFLDAKPSPVRTVTRRVIVPGLYGIVAVYREQDQVRVTLTREDGTPDQLEAAARTLQQLAEALREG